MLRPFWRNEKPLMTKFGKWDPWKCWFEQHAAVLRCNQKGVWTLEENSIPGGTAVNSGNCCHSQHVAGLAEFLGSIKSIFPQPWNHKLARIFIRIPERSGAEGTFSKLTSSPTLTGPKTTTSNFENEKKLAKFGKSYRVSDTRPNLLAPQANLLAWPEWLSYPIWNALIW